jgi:hypothetical protein
MQLGEVAPYVDGVVALSLAPDTRRRYLEVWSAHLLPRLGDYELREITPMAGEDFREQMSRANVGAPTQRMALPSPVTVEGIRPTMLEPRTRIVPAAGAGKRPSRDYEAIRQGREGVCGTHSGRTQDALCNWR